MGLRFGLHVVIKPLLQVDATVELPDFKGGKDFNEKITRAKFEELCLDLFKKTLLPVEKVLQDAGISKRQVDEIVLVGGSTRIPKVRALLKDYFNGKEPNQQVNPDEAVAYGAAVQAGLLAGSSYEIAAAGGSNIVLLDVTPLSMGIETTGKWRELFCAATQLLHFLRRDVKFIAAVTAVQAQIRSR